MRAVAGILSLEVVEARHRYVTAALALYEQAKRGGRVGQTVEIAGQAAPHTVGA
jgi:hypothetical protein